ncbi:MAG TPA: sulfite exporter TauE/SafE family protein [Gaiellaceae bacterium]|nr:sulfite exporter TauE/SafE family protein [Gaiellaceae bacterium]
MAGVAAWCFIVALLGTSIGLILGTIRLPVLLLVSSSPAAGAAANVGISTVAAATAATRHVRRGIVNWKVVLWMTPPSIAGALIGGYVSGRLPEDTLLVVIGVVLLYFGARTFIGRQDGGSPRTPRMRPVAAWGLVIGLLGGLVGLILSTLRLPALIRHIGETPHRAVATNLVVGFWLGVAAVIGHLPGGVDWSLMLLGSVASIPGALLGSRITGRLSERQLLNAIGVALLVAGSLTVVRGVV